jgi:hypothetical protein
MRRNCEELRRLDDEIHALEYRLIGLRTRRNNLMPLCQLPPEILARVLYFAQVANKDNPKKLHTPWINFDCNWHQYTHVCRRLRDVAVETPSLWTFIRCDTPTQPGKWAELCAARAKTCSLDIIGLGHHNFTSPEHFASTYLGRASRVYLGSRGGRETGQQRKYYNCILNTPLPLIEVLYCDMDIMTFPTHLVGGTSMTLTRLILLNVTFETSIGAIHFPSLRYLNLAISHMRVQGHHTKQFVTLLKGTPELETLVVELNCPQVDATIDEASISVSLPHLRTVHISGSATGVNGFLRVIPRPCRDLCIDVELDNEPEREVYHYILRFWSDVVSNHHETILEGRIEYSASEIGLFELGTSFDPQSEAQQPRMFFSYPYRAAQSLVPRELMKWVQCVKFVDNWEQDDINVFGDLGHHVQSVVADSVDDLNYLPPGLDDWLRTRAQSGHALRFIKFIDCALEERSTGELFNYARKLEIDGVVGSMRWTRWG